jgi:hypothetical protein
LAAAALFGSLAHAQCPAGTTNPLNLISGQTWAFETDDGLAGDATIGYFTASLGTSRASSAIIGVLNVAETYNNAGAIENQVTGLGSYSIYPDCSGGTLFLPGPKNAYQYTFYFAAGMTRMLIVTSNTSVPNNGEGANLAGNRGTALLQAAAPSCAGVTSPLSLLSGPTSTNWTFLLQDFSSASSGILNASVGTTSRAPGVTTGLLNVTETYSGASTPAGQVQFNLTGEYQMYPDCSGGTLLFNSGASSSYAFIFASPSELFLVSNSTNGPANTTGGVFRANYGVAFKQ